MPWTNIPNANLAAGAPIRSVDTIALRDNIPALAAGDSGAPKIQTLAIQDAAVTSAKLATGTNEVNWVLARTAGASAGGVGTYVFASTTSGNWSNVSFGGTRAGSALTPTAVNGSQGSTLSGTWRCMGHSFNATIQDGLPTLWLRIS